MWICNINCVKYFINFVRLGKIHVEKYKQNLVILKTHFNIIFFKYFFGINLWCLEVIQSTDIIGGNNSKYWGGGGIYHVICQPLWLPFLTLRSIRVFCHILKVQFVSYTMMLFSLHRLQCGWKLSTMYN